MTYHKGISKLYFALRGWCYHLLTLKHIMFAVTIFTQQHKTLCNALQCVLRGFVFHRVIILPLRISLNVGRSRSFCEVWERCMFITVLFFPNTPPYPAPMWAAARTDCRDLYNTQVIFKTPHPQNFHFRNFLRTWGWRRSKTFYPENSTPLGGYTHTQSCGGVLVEQVIPNRRAIWCLSCGAFSYWRLIGISRYTYALPSYPLCIRAV